MGIALLFLRERLRGGTELSFPVPVFFFFLSFPLFFRERVPGRNEDSMFSLKGRFSYDIPMRRLRNGVPGNFSPVPTPATGTDVGDHFIKLLYYSSGPCGGPGCPFSEAIFYCDICRGGLGPLRRTTGPYFAFFLPPLTLIRVESTLSPSSPF